MSLSVEYVTTSLKSLYGETITTPDVRAWCAMNDYSYVTISKRLTDYKIGRGKWNLTVQEQLEETYDSPSAQSSVVENLIPQKDNTFVQFVLCLQM